MDPPKRQTFLGGLLLSQTSAAAPHALRLSADHAGGGADVLHAVQTEVVSQIGEQHQRWGVQLQLLPAQDRALRWYVWVALLSFFLHFCFQAPIGSLLELGSH